MFKVRLQNLDYDWYLKGTTWTSTIERADVFATRELALAAFQRGKKFMQHKLIKKVEIVND